MYVLKNISLPWVIHLSHLMTFFYIYYHLLLGFLFAAYPIRFTCISICGTVWHKIKSMCKSEINLSGLHMRSCILCPWCMMENLDSCHHWSTEHTWFWVDDTILGKLFSFIGTQKGARKLLKYFIKMLHELVSKWIWLFKKRRSFQRILSPAEFFPCTLALLFHLLRR